MEAEAEAFISEPVRMNERKNVQQIFALVKFKIVVNLRKVLDKLHAWVLSWRLRILKTFRTGSLMNHKL